MSEQNQIEEMEKIIQTTRLIIMRGDVAVGETTLRGTDAWRLAERLYNEGYRRQRGWISVDERPPEESGEYFASTKSGLSMCLPYSAKYKMFNVYDGQDAEYAEKMAIEVTHWMPLPEPPKGE